MAGTLLVYDAAFPRARVATGPIRNTPNANELRANSYPEPYRLLPIWEASSPDTYFGAIADAAKSMGRLSRLIIFGHGVCVKTVESLLVAEPLFQNGFPGQAGLRALQDQKLEQRPIVVARQAPFGIVIGDA